ncbi:MAG: hypothetical protein ACBR20_22650 [Microcoleus sp.]
MNFHRSKKSGRLRLKLGRSLFLPRSPPLSSRCYQSQTIDPVPKPLFIPNPSLHCISDSIHFPISGYQIF